MLVILLILAAGSLSTLVFGAPIPFTRSSRSTAASIHSWVKQSADKYTVYGGNGDVSQGWPAQSSWVSSFDTM
jgi:hypothetical protein